MSTENVELMRMARESLKGKWGLAIGTFVVCMIIVGAIQLIPMGGGLLAIFITGQFTLGLTIFALSISRNQEAKLEQIFLGFNRYGTALGAYLLMALFTFLWTLLLIIPGIIAALSYSLTYFILADDETIGANDAIDKSKKMMDGYKWKLFCLGLRFFLLGLLCILTLGIGFFWLFPYIQVTYAKFYDDVKTNYIESQQV